MSEKVLHEWGNGRFCYRALGGSVPRIERGGVSNTTRVFAGLTVCNDAATVNELARLAAENAKLQACVVAADGYFEADANAALPIEETKYWRSYADTYYNQYRAARAELDKP